MDKNWRNKFSHVEPELKQRIDALLESISNLYEESIRDSKTKLYNNKFLETILDMEIEKAKRGQQKLSMIILDIDFFKKINDAYGHIKADELLIKLAQIVMKQIRKSDIAVRFGGEEFIVLLPETSLLKAKLLASRLKKAVHSDSMLKKHNLTISQGLTQFRKTDTKKSFKSRADKALYQAKKTGRDKFVLLK